MPKDKEAKRKSERARYYAKTKEKNQHRAAQMIIFHARLEKLRRRKMHSLANELHQLRKENKEI